MVAFYGGAGIAISSTQFKMSGYYPVPTADPAGPPYAVVTDASAIQDPIDITIENSDGSTMAPRLNAGIRFKFTVITIHFDYTYANYSVATAGLGISFR